MVARGTGARPPARCNHVIILQSVLRLSTLPRDKPSAVRFSTAQVRKRAEDASRTRVRTDGRSRITPGFSLLFFSRSNEGVVTGIPLDTPERTHDDPFGFRSFFFTDSFREKRALCCRLGRLGSDGRVIGQRDRWRARVPAVITFAKYDGSIVFRVDFRARQTLGRGKWRMVERRRTGERARARLFST